MSTDDVLGQPPRRGIEWPIRIDDRGGIALGTGGQDIDSSIAVILSTGLGERVMRPEFGCRIREAMPDPVDAPALEAGAQAVRDALARWEPRAEVHDVRLRDARSSADEVVGVHIDITYADRATGEQRYLYFARPRIRDGRRLVMLHEPDEQLREQWAHSADGGDTR